MPTTMARMLLLGIVFSLPAVVACGPSYPHGRSVIPGEALAILENAEQFEVLSVFPDSVSEYERLKREGSDYLKFFPEPPKGGAEAFHDHSVLGKTAVQDPQLRMRIVSEFEKAAWSGEPNKCIFWPRHGIRVTRAGKTVDFLICFDCGDVFVFGSGFGGHFFVSKPAKPALDAVLKSANIPQAP